MGCGLRRSRYGAGTGPVSGRCGRRTGSLQTRELGVASVPCWEAKARSPAGWASARKVRAALSWSPANVGAMWGLRPPAAAAAPVTGRVCPSWVMSPSRVRPGLCFPGPGFQRERRRSMWTLERPAPGPGLTLGTDRSPVVKGKWFLWGGKSQ